MSKEKYQVKYRYSIGEVSEISGLSIKSLRYYDEKKLFVPSEKDKNTGYRYYSEPQMAVAVAFGRLKKMGFTYAEIQNELLPLSIDNLQENLLKKIRAKQDEINEIKDQIRELDWEREQLVCGKNELKKSRDKPHTRGVIFRELPRTKVVYTRRISKTGTREEYWDRVVEMINIRNENNLTPVGGFMGIPYNQYMDFRLFEDCDFEMLMPIADKDYEAENTKMFGGFLVGSLTYKGKYEIMPDYIKILLEEIDKHKYKIAGPLIREYLVEFSLGIIDDVYITRLSFPIEPI